MAAASSKISMPQPTPPSPIPRGFHPPPPAGMLQNFSSVCVSLGFLPVFQVRGQLFEFILIGRMDGISTSFCKEQMNQCADRCIFTLQHSYFTPDEIKCFDRCTRNVTRFQPYAQRTRSDSEELRENREQK